jgi:hypothetical protein
MRSSTENLPGFKLFQSDVPKYRCIVHEPVNQAEALRPLLALTRNSGGNRALAAYTTHREGQLIVPMPARMPTKFALPTTSDTNRKIQLSQLFW